MVVPGAGGPEFRNRRVGRSYHMRNQRADGARRECGGQRAALMLPGPTFRDQQAVAKHRLEHADGGWSADIVFVIVDQHMPDRIRRVDDKTVAAEKAGLDDVLFIGTRTPGVDGVLSHRRHPPEQAHGPARRAWRHQRLPCNRDIVGFGNAHGRPRKTVCKPTIAVLAALLVAIVGQRGVRVP